MDQVNHSIKCNVTTCDYHAGRQNYCTLNGIQVGVVTAPSRRTVTAPSVLPSVRRSKKVSKMQAFC